MDKQVMYIPDVAVALGRSQRAIREYLRKQVWDAIPQPFRWAGRICWHPRQIEGFILGKAIEAGVIDDEQEQQVLTRRRPGRPRKKQA